MLYRKLWKGVLLMMLTCAIAHAHEGSNQDVKYQLSMCALFKNEGKFLKEWIEYHRLVGVDHFYLYDLGSDDVSREVLVPYVREGLVTLEDWPENPYSTLNQQSVHWILSRQIPAYENAIKVKAIYESKWFVIANVDEFLVASEDDSILDVLARYEHVPGIMFAQDCYDASQIDLNQGDLTIQASDITNVPTENKLKKVNKIIFKPDYTTGFTWAPYQVAFKNLQTVHHVNKQELKMNRYANRGMKKVTNLQHKEKMKVNKGLISEVDLKTLLSMGYLVEDSEKAIHRFIPHLMSRMGHE